MQPITFLLITTQSDTSPALTELLTAISYSVIHYAVQTDDVPTQPYPTAAVALIEWEGTGESALTAVRELRRQQPACHSLLTLPPERSAIRAALHVNASGYLMAPVAADELLSSVKAVQEGGCHWNETLLMLLTTPASQPPAYPHGLSRREQELWDHLANGLTNPEIEERMYLSGSRIKNMKNEMAQKLMLPSARHLTARAIRWASRPDKSSTKL